MSSADQHLENARVSLRETLDSVHQVIAEQEEFEFTPQFQEELYTIARTLNNIKRTL